jgi:S-adenosylmethionine:tRNA ribosyltransferase-isomerase
MRIEEFDYTLPSCLIAQYPSPQRGESHLMVLHRSRGTIEHQDFRDLLNYLHPGDLLVTNDSRVLPARLIGKKETGGKCELLLIPSWNGTQGTWEVLIKKSKKIERGAQIRFGEGLYGELKEVKNGRGKICFSGQGDVMEILQKTGRIPLPPYIKREDEPLDRDRYQTIFAERDGSIAAPTAGLHFTHSLIETLKDQGVKTTSITLHIGAGTFVPVRTRDIEDHTMGAEWVEISEETGREIEETKRRAGKIFAVGTTTAKAIESFSSSEGRIKPGKSYSSLFIHPPYRFRIIDGLITNFHLPKSTLMMLVSAFAGKDLLMKAYREAIDRKYRFYSYGDAMLVL